jgi:hypothetical protein
MPSVPRGMQAHGRLPFGMPADGRVALNMVKSFLSELFHLEAYSLPTTSRSITQHHAASRSRVLCVKPAKSESRIPPFSRKSQVMGPHEIRIKYREELKLNSKRTRGEGSWIKLMLVG